MKTKNVKARLQDIKQGVTLYTSHPIYGIDVCVVIGKPYMNKNTRSLFIPVVVQSSLRQGTYKTERSLCDMGVTALYNDCRTFFKLKQAKEWQNKWINDKGFQQRQAEHEEWCAMMDDYNQMDWED